MDRRLEGKLRKEYSDGEMICRQGDRGSEMYVIHRGKVRVFRNQDGHDTTLAMLEPGDFLGEMALFDDRPRSASAKAVGKTEVRVVTQADYMAMECDPIIRAVLGTLAERLRAMDDAFEKMSVESESRREFLTTRSLRHEWLV